MEKQGNSSSAPDSFSFDAVEEANQFDAPLGMVNYMARDLRMLIAMATYMRLDKLKRQLMKSYDELKATYDL